MKTRTLLALSVLTLAIAAPAGANVFWTNLNGWWVAGTAPQDYELAIVSSGCLSGKCAMIKASAAAPQGFATLMQQLAPDAYRGKRLRVSARIRTENAAAAELWMRIDGPGSKVLGFYNMDDHPVSGTTGWKRYDVVLDVPAQAVGVAFGYFLRGKGAAWADDFKLETVGKDVPVSAFAAPQALPKTPANLGFDH